MEINHQVAKEVNTLIEHVNCRGEETKELDNVMKNLLVRFSTMEDRVRVLEEENIEKAAMVRSLLSEVEWLQGQICHCNKPRFRALSGSRTAEDLHKLEYALDSEYVALPVIRSLVPIGAGGEQDLLQASWFRDDEEERSVIAETRESSESVAAPEENKVPIPVYITSPPPEYTCLVRQDQCCVHSDGLLKKSLYHPYRHNDTCMGMPAGLRSTKDL